MWVDFNNEFSIADSISIVLFMAATASLFFTFRQVRQARMIERAKFFKDLYLTLYSDEEIRKVFYKIEYDEFVYNDGFHGSEDEPGIDGLLSFSDLVCDLYGQGLLTTHEMSFFRYEFLRIFQNGGIRAYLAFLTDFYNENRFGTSPFPSFVKYCESALQQIGREAQHGDG